MKENSAYYIICFIAIIYSIYANFQHLYNFTETHNYKLVNDYSYSYLFTYISIPILIITGVLFFYSLFMNPKSILDILFICLWILHLFIVIYLNKYFNHESNEIVIVIKNSTIRNYKKIEIKARNNQYFEQSNFRSGDSLEFLCECRNEKENANSGIRILLNDESNFNKMIEEVYANSHVTIEKYRIEILNDNYFKSNVCQVEYFGCEGISKSY